MALFAYKMLLQFDKSQRIWKTATQMRHSWFEVVKIDPRMNKWLSHRVMCRLDWLDDAHGVHIKADLCHEQLSYCSWSCWISFYCIHSIVSGYTQHCSMVRTPTNQSGWPCWPLSSKEWSCDLKKQTTENLTKVDLSDKWPSFDITGMLK